MLDLQARDMPLARTMLIHQIMMAKLGLLGMLLLSSVAFADRPTAAPDFTGGAPRRHIDRSLVASPDGKSKIDPFDQVTFDLNGAQLSSLELGQVDAAATWLKAHPDRRIVLEGHTDGIGASAYNEDLAMRRIDSVRRRLLAHGIAQDRIVMISFGETESRDLADPLSSADRKVVMYTTPLAPQAAVAMVRDNRPAVVAYWSEHGNMVQILHGVKTSAQTLTATRR
jgi:hypothetical protein